MFFILPPSCLAIILTSQILSWLGWGQYLNLLQALIYIVLMAAAAIIMGTIASILWYFVMSFYLTVQEWQDLNVIPTSYYPVITPVITKILNSMLAWKIRRESKRS